MKYVKKPIVIEAIKWNPNSSTEIIPDWFFNSCKSREIYPEFDGTLTIKTLEGNMTAQDGDYIIKGIAGEIYPCKPDIFEQSYSVFVE